MTSVHHSEHMLTYLEQLNQQQRHDLRSALLSVRWAADLLRPADGSEPPLELIADQLHHAYAQLQPVIDLILNHKGQNSE